jgi:rod shape-determining protein MreC
MLKTIKEYRFYILLFFFILLPVLSIDTSTRASREYNWFDKTIVTLTSPIQFTLTWGIEKIVDGIQNYILLLSTKQDFISVMEENRKLQNTISSLKEAEAENRRLREMLDFKETFKFRSVTARVIAKDVSTEFRVVRINRGESSDIKKDMAVVTPEGIVGRVLRTTANTADVVTILDLLSAIDVIVERSRARGIVQGQTDSSCQLRFALRTDDLQLGDILISSGLGGIFPKGLQVGLVARVNRLSYGITQEVEVQPSVNFSRLEEVQVILDVDEHIIPQTPLPPPAKKKESKG